ncbi:MAG: hypothetical protein ACP5KE_09745 [Candidatus Methanodesulfokora sp.]
MDSSFNWHKYIAPGEGERFATVGKLSFKLVPEMGIKESRLPIIEKLRKKKGVQYVLVAELFPWIPDQEEIRNWLSYVQAKGLIDRLPEIETTMQKLQFRVKDLESKNLLLQEEVLSILFTLRQRKTFRRETLCFLTFNPLYIEATKSGSADLVTAPPPFNPLYIEASPT